MSEDEESENSISEEYTSSTGSTTETASFVPLILIISIFLLTKFIPFPIPPLILNILYTILVFFQIMEFIVIIPEYKKGILLSFGQFRYEFEKGIHFILPIRDVLYILDLRTQVFDVEPQEIMTSDSAPVRVDAVVYYRVVDAKKAVLNVADYVEASVKFAQTTLRNIIGQNTLTDVLTKKDTLGKQMQKILDKETDKWGIKVENVEIKDVILPEGLKRAMVREAEAEREKKARLIKSKAELEAAKNFLKAAKLIDQSESALQLRQLQTWSEIGAEQNSMIIVVPSEIIATVSNKLKNKIKENRGE
ncbi:MAG: slipin family protein [Candidatus Heimdallarchaeaceae archaeon]